MSSDPKMLAYIRKGLEKGRFTLEDLREIANGVGEERQDVSVEALEKMFPALCDCHPPPMPMELVKEILIYQGIHVFAGLFESYKSMWGLEISASILKKGLVSGFFPVLGDDELLDRLGIVWLNFDMPHNLFWDYAANFGLTRNNRRFRVNNPAEHPFVAIDDPRLKAFVKDRILVIDTMLDAAMIKDAFQSREWIEFFRKLRSLINEHGCLAILLITHPTKQSQKVSSIDPADYLKDSVTFGGKIDVGFAMRKVADSCEVHIERIKSRGFKERDFKFSVMVNDSEGNSNIDKGCFPIGSTPEEKVPFAKRSHGGAPPKKRDANYGRVIELHKQGKSTREIAKEFEGDPSPPSQTSIVRWIKEYEGKAQSDMDFKGERNDTTTQNDEAPGPVSCSG